MERKDLRKKIIINNIEKLNIKSLITLDTVDDEYLVKLSPEQRRISSTDYAVSNLVLEDGKKKTKLDKKTSTSLLYNNDGDDLLGLALIYNDGDVDIDIPMGAGICPSIKYELPKKEEKKKFKFIFNNLAKSKDYKIDNELNIKEVKDSEGNILYRTLQLGEYPKSKVQDDLDNELESLYNNGNLEESIKSTGRWYTYVKEDLNIMKYGKVHNPEFEYKNNRYVRVVKNGNPVWFEVEPISFIIKNWDDMPKSINPEGTEKAKYFELRAEENICGEITFDYEDFMCSSEYINSFLNGDGKENDTSLLNEAFNLSREPMIEYNIMDEEQYVPENAFEGCVSLEKIYVDSSVNYIGVNAFKGVDFKYCYKDNGLGCYFSKELLKNKDEYKFVVDLDFLKSKLIGVTTEDLMNKRFMIKDLENIAINLKKVNFEIPYEYGLELVGELKLKKFFENSRFDFIKNEVPKLTEMLKECDKNEKNTFFKFINALGCFSNEKMKDKNGKETNVIKAQKACSLLANILKLDEMKLRR